MDTRYEHKCMHPSNLHHRHDHLFINQSFVSTVRAPAMASLALSAAPCSLSSSSSLSGLRLPSPSPRPSLSMSPLLPARASVALPKHESQPSDQDDMRRRALVFGAFASALALASNLPVALADEPKKKRNKCPTICVQNPTASCCFGN